MTHAVIPLITLADGRAPYKGTWCLVQHVTGGDGGEPAGATARDGPNQLEAIHTTYHPDHNPGCEIERMKFNGEELARQFVHHLLLHNWGVRNVHRAGEAFWIALPG